MPRGARLDALGALHPVVIHGIERGTIVNDGEDRENFTTRMEELAQETETIIYAIIRWADDFILGFEYEKNALRVMDILAKRLEL